jgi:predicted MFS family arabinose efflux permease
MTRGTVAVLRGQLGQAVAYNPASPLLLVGAVLAVGRWLVGRLTGRWLDATPRPTPITSAVAAIVVFALWVNQQTHATLLR